MKRILMLLAALTMSATTALAVPNTMNYQGQLFLNGNPTSGPVAITFRMYDAETGGTLLWTETDNVTVTGGLFSTILGDGTVFPANLFSAQVPWLEMEVSGQVLAPRTQFQSVPYALNASVPGGELWDTDGTNVWRTTGGVGINTQTLYANDKLDVNGGAYIANETGIGAVPIGGVPLRVAGFVRVDGGPAGSVRMMSNGSFGVVETIDNTPVAIQPSGGNVGIGTTSPAYKLDVAGDVRATTFHGNFSGTISNADLLDGIDGSQFLRNDQTGIVNGNLTINGTGTGNAVTINTTASSAGLLIVQNGNAAGIRSRANSSTTVNGAVVGTALADGGSGVYGETGSLGVPGGPQDPNGASVGVFGNAHATGQSVGGAALGVYGRVASYQPPAGGAGIPAGVFGKADSDIGRNAGVIGETDSRTEGFGVRSYGNLGVSGDIYYTGSLIRTTLTPNGPVSLQQMNTAGDWCEDVGEGQMVDGRGHVELDPMFLKTVTIDEKRPIKIFVQPLAPCSGVYVQKGLTGFDVIELAGGKSSISFDYRVVAVRKGGEDSRFRTTPAAVSVLEEHTK